MSEQEPLDVRLYRQQVRDEEQAAVKEEMAAAIRKDVIVRSLVVAALLYGSLGLLVLSAVLGLSIRLFLLTSGL